MVKFHQTYWHFVDEGGSQRGPVLTRMILHKLKEGDIDGFTLVYNQVLGKWVRISDVPELRIASQKIMQAEDSLSQQKIHVPLEQQVFFDVDDDSGVSPATAYQAMLVSTKTSSAAEASEPVKKKTFRADNGVRYCWDEEEEAWVEDDDLTQSDNEQAVGAGNSDEGERSEDEKDESAAIADGSQNQSDTSATQKRKRNKKKKVKKLPNHWVYITGLPVTVTIEEVQAHFSKVCLTVVVYIFYGHDMHLSYNEDKFFPYNICITSNY